MVADPKPHPLVKQLEEGIDDAFRPAAVQFSTDVPSGGIPIDKLTALLRDRSKPFTLLTLTGYLGEGKDPRWIRLYVDETLNSFYILQKVDIVNFERRKAEDAAKGEIDVVWLSRDAQIARGRRQPRPNDQEAKFIDGGFVAASDVAGSLAADRRGAAAGGWYVDTTTPACCRHPSSSFPR